MDTTNALQKIEARMTARAFQAGQHPQQGGVELVRVLRGCKRCWVLPVKLGY